MARPQGTEEKGTACTLEKFEPGGCIWCPSCKNPWRKKPPRRKRAQRGFQHWKGRSSQGFQRRKGFRHGLQQGLQEALYHLFYLHSVLFQATMDVLPQLVQRDASVAEQQARGDSAASVVDSVSVAWQARDVVTWPWSAAAKPGCSDSTRFVQIEGTVNKIQCPSFVRSVCIRIGYYAHAGCRVTNAFKKRLTETITTLTVGVVGVRRIASGIADI